MASYKPLVFNTTTGITQQLQAGDTLDGITSVARSRAMTNANAGTINIGSPVYVSAADSVDLARANSGSTAKCIGLVMSTSIATTASGAIITNGQLSATTAQWDTVTGETGGLVANTDYYLSKATAGKLVASLSGFTTGDYVVKVGRAYSTTDMEVEPEAPVLL